MRVAPAIELTEPARLQLEKIARQTTASVRFARRARIILLSVEGMTNLEIAAKLEIGRLQVPRCQEDVRHPYN